MRLVIDEETEIWNGAVRQCIAEIEKLEQVVRKDMKEMELGVLPDDLKMWVWADEAIAALKKLLGEAHE